MKIEAREVTKLVFSELDKLDPIKVVLEDVGKGKGSINIECYDRVWSSYWGAMGCGIIEFFTRSTDDYLASKLSPSTKEFIDDNDGLVDKVRSSIIELRKDNDLSKSEARFLYDDSSCLVEGVYSNEDLLRKVYGTEWFFEDLPEKVNSDYTYLCDVIKTVQIGLKKYNDNNSE